METFNNCFNGMARCCDVMCAGFCGVLYVIFAWPCRILAKWFRARFALCLLFATIFCLVPGIWMIIVMAQASGFPCRQHWLKGHFVTLGILNILNWVYVLYLVNRYGNKYSIKGAEAPGRDNFLQRTADLIVFDIATVLFILLALFELAWLIIGICLIAHEPRHSPCFDAMYMNQFPTLYLLNIIGGWVFWLVGVGTFLFTLAVYGCTDGSCVGNQCASCFCRVVTCNLYDPLRNRDAPEQAYRAPVDAQGSDMRSSWVRRARILLTGMGVYRGIMNEHDYRVTEVDVEGPPVPPQILGAAVVQGPQAVVVQPQFIAAQQPPAGVQPAQAVVVENVYKEAAYQTGPPLPATYLQPAPGVGGTYANYNPTGAR